MDGAESLIRTLAAAGVDHCFANPGTSEMHLVRAIDAVDEIRAILCLFEGVCTGAADGFARMSGRPASTLLHLGAGLGNGVANLHNARRAYTPMINLVGDHAIHHVHHDAPLTADIETIARSVSTWVRTAQSAEQLAQDGADAYRAAMTRHTGSLGQIATLIIPADCAWGAAHGMVAVQPQPQPRQVTDAAVAAAAAAMDDGALLVLDGDALQEKAIRLAASICAASGARLCCSTFPARVDLAPDLPQISHMPYFPEQVWDFLSNVRTLVMVGAKPPVSFFAYRETPSNLVPKDTKVVRLSHRSEDSLAALEALADRLGVGKRSGQRRERPDLPKGKLSIRNLTQSLAALVPENAIISVDSGGGRAAFEPVQGITPLTWLSLTGGSIGQGGPVALGAAIACPERPVIALLGDGGAMYTIQALWTMARETLNVTTVIFNNQAYDILRYEYRRLGITHPGSKAASLFDLSEPTIDWATLGTSMGVQGHRVETAEDFSAALANCLHSPGPALIDCRLDR